MWAGYDLEHIASQSPLQVKLSNPVITTRCVLNLRCRGRDQGLLRGGASRVGDNMLRQLCLAGAWRNQFSGNLELIRVARSLNSLELTRRIDVVEYVVCYKS